jgi:hypothetical protein
MDTETFPCAVYARETREQAYIAKVLTFDEARRIAVNVAKQLPVIGRDENFGWGVWSSLSDQSFAKVQQVWERRTATRPARSSGGLPVRCRSIPRP